MGVSMAATPYGSWVRRDARALVTFTALMLFAVCGVLPGSTLRRDIGSLAEHLRPGTAKVEPSLDAVAVAEKAGHALTAVPGASGALQVADAGYRATFDRAGVHFRPEGATSGLGIGLAAIQRGGAAIHLDAGSWSADVNVARRPVANGVREQATARRGTVEWDVVLDHPVAGRGDLVISADLTGVAGPPRPAAGREGLHLSLDDGTRVRLGQTMVVDATGAELYRATPTVARGRVEMTVPTTVLERATYPLTIDPTVSGTTPVSTNVASAEPAVAFDGADFLVVWTEAVNGTIEVYGAQVKGDGTQVQPTGAISTVDATTDRYPSVAWNGTRFLVVWDDAFSATDHDIYGRQVNPAGVPLGSPFPLASSATNQSKPSVTAGGSNFYAVWTAQPSSDDVYGGRVDTNGALLDGNGGRVVVGAGLGESAPDVDWNGTSYLVTYERLFITNDPDIYGQQVDASANPVGTPFPIATVSGPEQAPKVASNGSDHLVVWQRGGDILGARVSSSGVVLGGVTVSSATNTQSTPDVAFNGVYLVAWRDRRDDHNAIWAARVATDGTVQDSDGILVEPGTETGGFSGPAVAAGPGGKWAIDYDNALTAGITQRSVAPK